MSKFQPFSHSVGSRQARIAFVGEAWGEHEERFGTPLVWYSGLELAKMLGEVGLAPAFGKPNGALEPALTAYWHRTGHFYTNVFAERPPGNNLDSWCVPRKELLNGYNHPPIKPGHYIRLEYLPHLERLYEELRSVRPNLIVCMGNIACWALLHKTAISTIRGSITWSDIVGLKVLPTFHPAAVLRQWDMRTIVKQDLLKAGREAQFPEIRRPQRSVIVAPTLQDIALWSEMPAERYAVDIETHAGQITMIGFARSRSDILVIPFVEFGKSYWERASDEVQAWLMVKALLEKPIPKIFHNGLYDLSYLVKLGFRPKCCTEDTMLLHHALFPELRKGLGFLGSIYTDEAAWKILRSRKRDETFNKREE